MSDGARESGTDSESISRGGSSSGGDDFGRAISRIAVAQICESTGLHSIRCSALDALSDILIQYICDLGRASHFYANLSGRTCCNVFDVFQGLEDVGSTRGSGCTFDVHCRLVNSVAMREIMQYMSTADENPFAHTLPHFPIACHCKSTPTFAQVEEVTAGKHIPGWLLAFPDAHTYIYTPVWDENRSEPSAGKIEQSRQRRKAERSLLSLQQRLASCTTAVPASVDDGDSGKGKQGADSDPILTPRLPFGEVEGAPNVIPTEAATEKKASVLETFASAIEAVKNGFLDSGSCETKVMPRTRPTVRFKLGAHKKSLAVPLQFNALGAGKTGLWLCKDDEKDDKKRRAEMILREAMENPQELVQL